MTAFALIFVLAFYVVGALLYWRTFRAPWYEVPFWLPLAIAQGIVLVFFLDETEEDGPPEGNDGPGE